MGEFLAILLSMPTVIFTVPLGLSVLYWLFVVVGAVDLEMLDGVLDGPLDGALDGAADGALDGALDGAADGALDGAADGALDADVDVDIDASGASMLATLLSALKLTKVPLTVSLSFIVLFSWLASFLATVHVAPLIPLPAAVLGVGITLASLFAGTLAASVAVRPLGSMFHTERGRGNRHFIGHVVTISTGSVTERHGQADLTERDHNLIVQVRDRGGQGMKKGDKALLIQWDAEEDAFIAEKMDLAAAAGDEAAARIEAIDRVKARARARREVV